MGSARIVAVTGSNRQALDLIQEFKPCDVQVPGYDLVFIQGQLNNPCGEDAVACHHEAQVLARNHYITAYVEQQHSFLERTIRESEAELKALDGRIKSTPEFVEIVEHERRAVADFRYEKKQGATRAPRAAATGEPRDNCDDRGKDLEKGASREEFAEVAG